MIFRQSLLLGAATVALAGVGHAQTRGQVPEATPPGIEQDPDEAGEQRQGGEQDAGAPQERPDGLEPAAVIGHLRTPVRQW